MISTVELVKMNYGDIICVLSDLRNLILEVEVCKLCNVARFEVVDGLRETAY